MIMVAVLGVLLPPAVLIPVHGAVQFGSNCGRAAMLLPHIKRSVVPPFLLGSLAGAALGAAAFVQLPPGFIQIGIGAFVLWSVFGTIPALGHGHVTISGIVSTFLTMFFGATGPFVAAMVKSLKLDPVDHVATHAALMTIQHFVKVVAFGILGFAFGAYLPLVVAMILSGLIGTYAGKHLLVRAGKAYFKPILNLILILLAIQLIWTGSSNVLDRSGQSASPPTATKTEPSG